VLKYDVRTLNGIFFQPVQLYRSVHYTLCLLLMKAEESVVAGRKRERLPEGQTFVMPQHAFSLRSLDILLRALLQDRAPAHQAALSR
jgi:hypothetical protein